MAGVGGMQDSVWIASDTVQNIDMSLILARAKTIPSSSSGSGPALSTCPRSASQSSPPSRNGPYPSGPGCLHPHSVFSGEKLGRYGTVWQAFLTLAFCFSFRSRYTRNRKLSRRDAIKGMRMQAYASILLEVPD